MRILLAGPRGFCAGVNMAIEALERAVERFGTPLYVLHEIVHNRHVVENFRRQGVVFVEHLDQVPVGSRLMYSAHGVSPAVRALADGRRLEVIDSTCPLVRKVHLQAARFAREGYTIVLIGHRGHDEVIGTLGQVPGRITLIERADEVDSLVVANPDKLAYLTQTTLSVDEAQVIIDRLRERFPRCVGSPSEDICYATQNRQEALKALVGQSDFVLVIGSRNSSNSNRLAEVARDAGRPARLIDGAAEIDPDWFDGNETVLITAGASAPEHLVQECVEWLRDRFQASVEHHQLRRENVEFPLPLEVR